MRIGGLDIESTGLDVLKGHRIVEIAIGIYDWTPEEGGNQVGKTWVQRVNPMRSIDPGAQAVHGISLAELTHAPTWEAVAPSVCKLMNACDVVVAHNAAFDMPFVAHEIDRIGLKMPGCEIFCTMENGRSCTPMGKVPNLETLCWAFGVEYNPDDAHAADYDVNKMMSCLFRGLCTGAYTLPVPIRAMAAA